MAALRVLSVAVASGRAGYVFLDGTQLYDWGVTVKATSHATELVAFVQELINTLQPDVVVTEKCDPQCRKGTAAQRLIGSISELASHNYVLDVTVPRPRTYPSKYEEAEQLVARHSELAGYLPSQKRRIFDFEPRNMIIFEALALAREVIDGSPERLAAAMG